MGVDLGELFKRERIEIEDLSGKWVAADAFNMLYQFLAIIRQKDGTPLMDSQGRVTSHLSGLLYRTANLMEAGVKVAFVFDGKPSPLKMGTLEQRGEVREKAAAAWEEARATGQDGFKYAQAASRINSEILDDGRRLISAMGLPAIQAPSEGEAQAAHMAARGDVGYAGSQDYDVLLFGAPMVVRNLAITGKRKLPRKNIYVDIQPEIIDLNRSLMEMASAKSSSSRSASCAAPTTTAASPVLAPRRLSGSYGRRETWRLCWLIGMIRLRTFRRSESSSCIRMSPTTMRSR